MRTTAAVLSAFKSAAHRSGIGSPELYSRNGLPMVRAAGAALDEVWPDLSWSQPTLPVLDVGCGPGDIARKVLAPRLTHGTRIVSCDVSPGMLDYARQHNSLPGVISYQLLDVVTPDLQQTAVWPHAPFSKVFAFLLLHWVPDNRAAVRNIFSLLAPGGQALFTIIAKCSLFTLYSNPAEHSKWRKYMKDADQYISPYYHSAKPADDFRQLLLEEGFQVQRCWSDERRLEFDSEEEVKQLIVSVNAFLHRIPDEEKQEFIDDCFEAHLKFNTFGRENNANTEEKSNYFGYLSLIGLAMKPLSTKTLKKVS